MISTEKSIISWTIAKTFADQGQLEVSFFFKWDEDDQNNAKKFFITISTQLIFWVPEMILYVEKAINADSMIFNKTMKEQFEKFILQSLLKMKSSAQLALQLVIVIDALDECEQEKNVKVIFHLLSHI